MGREALTAEDASSVLAARVRLDAGRAGGAAGPAVLAGGDLDRVAFAGAALVVSGPAAAADFGALSLADVVAADALAGAVERPAGAVLAASGRAGGVVPLPV